MNRYGMLLTVILSLATGSAMAAAGATSGDEKKIGALIKQLGHASFRQREAATKELDAIGEAALNALHQAARNSDIEIAERAGSLIARIEQRLENARLIAPTLVELKLQDVPVEQAVAELARTSGFSITISSDKSKLADRRVSLETGKVAFWKALELTCEKAGLSDAGQVAGPTQPPGAVPLPAPANPVQPLPGRRGVGQPVVNQQISLTDGRAKPVPTHIEGAFRIRAVRDASAGHADPLPPDEFAVPLEIRAEPKIQLQRILGVKIDKAIDESHQPLVAAMVGGNEVPIAFQQALARAAVLEHSAAVRNVAGLPSVVILPARFKKGAKETNSIKELRGTVALQIRTPVEVIVAVENVLGAKGQTARGKSASSLKINNISREENGEVTLEVELQYSNEIQPLRYLAPSGLNAQGPAFINSMGLELVDAKGQPFQGVRMPVVRNRVQGNARACVATYVFRPNKDQGEAFSLQFKGSRLASVEVPFQLKDVPVK